MQEVNLQYRMTTSEINETLDDIMGPVAMKKIHSDGFMYQCHLIFKALVDYECFRSHVKFPLNALHIFEKRDKIQ